MNLNGKTKSYWSTLGIVTGILNDKKEHRRTWIWFVREISAKSATQWCIDVWLRFCLTRVPRNDVCPYGLRDGRAVKKTIGTLSCLLESRADDYTFDRDLLGSSISAGTSEDANGRLWHEFPRHVLLMIPYSSFSRPTIHPYPSDVLIFWRNVVLVLMRSVIAFVFKVRRLRFWCPRRFRGVFCGLPDRLLTSERGPLKYDVGAHVISVVSVSSISREKYDCHSRNVYCKFSSSRRNVERDRRRKRRGKLGRACGNGCLELKVHRTLWRTRCSAILRKSIIWSSSCNAGYKTITARLSFPRYHLSDSEIHWLYRVIGGMEDDPIDQIQISPVRVPCAFSDLVVWVRQTWGSISKFLV